MSADNGSAAPEEIEIEKMFIVSDGTATWIGKPRGTAFPMPAGENDPGPPFLILNPAWQDIGGFQGDQAGNVGRKRLCAPIDWLPSQSEVWLRPVRIIPLSSLGEKDVRDLKRALAEGELIRKQLSAKQGGIELAGAMPKAAPGRIS